MLEKLISNTPETRAGHLLLEKVETRSQRPGETARDGRDAGLRVRNWIIREIPEFDYSCRESGVDGASDLGARALMFCLSSPELTPTFVFTLLPAPPPGPLTFAGPQLHLSASYSPTGTDLSSFANISVSKSQL